MKIAEADERCLRDETNVPDARTLNKGQLAYPVLVRCRCQEQMQHCIDDACTP